MLLVSKGMDTASIGQGSPEDQNFAMYNVLFFAQISEGKIRVYIRHRYNDYMSWVQ